jgi:acetyltransferase-like isoleucine patch superfamily enzyme
MKLVALALLLLLPWPVRREILRIFFGFNISKGAYIGWSIIVAKKVALGANSRIGHLSIIRGLDALVVGENGRLGNMNWISGYPSRQEESRRSVLVIEDNAAITHRHLFDCADQITIGRFATVAGWNSQFITHSIDLRESRQTSAPIHVGEYCFVGSRSVLLKGTSLPNNSILAAGSTLTSKHTDGYAIYGGVPAKKVGDLPSDLAYFQRKIGFVD